MARTIKTHRSGIYEIVNKLNGKSYVGSAVNMISRWNGHRMYLRRGLHHSRHLQAAWNKYGSEAFEFRRLIICDRRDLLVYEQIAINAIRPEYNTLLIAGSSIGWKPTPETRAKIGAKARGRKWSPESIAKLSATTTGRKLAPEHAAKLIGNKHAAGRKHTDEWKRQASIRNTGVKRPKSPEYRAKIAAGLRGRKATPQHRANQAAAQLGKKRGTYRPMTPEVRARAIAIRRSKPNPLIGFKHSTESRARNSAGQRGKILTPEHRSKITAGLLIAWARRKHKRSSSTGQGSLFD